MIPMQFALRRRMMMAGGGGAPISDLPLGALINVGTDGGAGTPNYEIADKDNLVSGGVVLVRKIVHSKSAFGFALYSKSTLDTKMTSIYNNYPEMLKSKVMDATFKLYNSAGEEIVTRKVFALSYTMVGGGDLEGIAEGHALQLYNSDVSRIKNTVGGNATHWWLSSRLSRDESFCIKPAGYISRDYPGQSFSVIPAFVIPSDTLYSATPNTDSSYNLIL